MNRFWGCVGGISGGFAVAAGAFGAHGLKSAVSPQALAVFETAARYHMYHAVAIIAVFLVACARPSRVAPLAGWCFLLGTILFSGSLYAMALSDMAWRFLGAVTPFGGLFMIAGWILFAVAATGAPATSGRRDTSA